MILDVSEWVMSFLFIGVATLTFGIGICFVLLGCGIVSEWFKQIVDRK
jgi:hypothetical protein